MTAVAEWRVFYYKPVDILLIMSIIALFFLREIRIFCPLFKYKKQFEFCVLISTT